MKQSNIDTLEDIIQLAAETCVELAERIKCFQETFEREKPETIEESCSLMNTPAGVEMVEYFQKVIRSQREVGSKLRKFCSEELISHLDNEKTAFLLYKEIMENKKVFSPEAIINEFLGHVAAREESIFDNLKESLRKIVKENK